MFSSKDLIHPNYPPSISIIHLILPIAVAPMAFQWENLPCFNMLYDQNGVTSKCAMNRTSNLQICTWLPSCSPKAQDWEAWRPREARGAIWGWRRRSRWSTLPSASTTRRRGRGWRTRGAPCAPWVRRQYEKRRRQWLRFWRRTSCRARVCVEAYGSSRSGRRPTCRPGGLSRGGLMGVFGPNVHTVSHSGRKGKATKERGGSIGAKLGHFRRQRCWKDALNVQFVHHHLAKQWKDQLWHIFYEIDLKSCADSHTAQWS